MDLYGATALVIDGNPTSRSILVSQLRDMGARMVAQSPRIADARRQLEFRTFDVVVCEQNFPNDTGTGQALLDDLRRAGLLPFATVFIMVTTEASYSKVAEAAESALDSYLLKPFTANQLAQRIGQARHRKTVLRDIFEAVEAQRYEEAARLCLQRFEQRQDYWLYAARVGAELLLRLGRYDEAQRLYEAVVEAKALPWARLGVARAQIESGQLQKANQTLHSLIDSEPDYADAYDVMGRAQIELGNFDAALAAYKMATDLTPASISRLQRHGMLAHYCGQRDTAEALLARSVRLGLDSKMFDAQTLVLLGFMRFEAGDRKGLQRYWDDALRMVERHPKSWRLRRLAQVLEIALLLLDAQVARVLERLRAMMATINDEDFDFEAACNLATLLAYVAQRAIQIDEVEERLTVLGRRFCTSKALTALLAQAASAHPPYAERLAALHNEVLGIVEHAMRQSLAGNPRAAVRELIAQGEATCNAKIIESAWGVLKRYESRIEDAAALAELIQPLRTRYQSYTNKPVIGDKAARQAGGVSLRVMDVATADT
ncbi:response regulator [Tepidimonas taiwanensis]|uniref:Chemotaxis protein CheY n=1 Tax=Tepidimonas taiwanensis TaxID=307486 RepID=A0A554X336_9BURK|nr:response regulator [Tepidimonas taiwanensis]MCX7693647.1 response regulator [Tepidimonas taiwanensis]TSE30261.1 Chemotaxis protein CheY [Tepidimonas taiwanensis]UBQ04804.1 response regulator [Tepidimonas taiwanensis]